MTSILFSLPFNRNLIAMNSIRTVFRFVVIFVFLAFISACGSKKPTLVRVANPTPKREFRGTWIQTVGQTRYQQMNSAAMKQYIADMVRKLDEAGINAVIFQVRPEPLR